MVNELPSTQEATLDTLESVIDDEEIAPSKSGDGGKAEEEVIADDKALVKRLHKSCQKGDVQVVRGVIAGVEEAMGERPHTKHQHAVVRKILSTQDKEEWSALHFAAQGTTPQHTQIIKMLCKAGADVNCKDNRGWGPLHLAAQFAEEAGIHELIESLADRQMKDKNLMTPMACANGVIRRRLLERPQDRLEFLLIKVRAVIAEHEARGNKFTKVRETNFKRIENINELCKELTDALVCSRHDLSLIERRLEKMMDSPMDDHVSFTQGFNQCKDLINLKSDLRKEQDELDEGMPEVLALQMIVATEYLLVALAWVYDKFLELRLELSLLVPGGLNADFKVKRLSTYRKCLEKIDVALNKGKKGGEDAPLDQGHWASKDVLQTATNMLEAFGDTEYHTQDKQKKQFEKEVVEALTAYKPEPGPEDVKLGSDGAAFEAVAQCSCQ